MKTQRILYVFTSTFPYGNAETFLEDEIGYLSESFSEVIIVPFSRGNNVARKTLDNCKIVTPVVKNRYMQYFKGLLLPLSLGVFLKEFFDFKVYADRRRLKAWLVAYVLTNDLLSSGTVRSIFKKINRNDVCYFYWGKGANVLSYFYEGRACFVSRFHGEWDLWEESCGGYAPLRKQIANSLDAAVFISQRGKRYFEDRYGGCKTFFYPLGSLDKGVCTRQKTSRLRIVSCSTVYPLKRVPLIFDALKKIKGYNIEWTHIGGGVDLDDLKKDVVTLCPPNIHVNLLGEMSHDKVMDYYCKNQFDVFVNVSTNEGVPVSIMEAMSFDIPVVATNVGGNSEVVTAESGILISANPDVVEVADAIVRLYNKGCHPRSFWEEHYSAEVNYTQFADFLKTM